MKKERNTIQKTLIKETVLNMCTHPTADQVYDAVKEKFPNIGRATVYRVLNDLAEKGEIYRVKVVDGPDRFDKTVFKHYHVKCVKCGRVADTCVPVVEGMEDVAEESSGFEIIGHEVGFTGICPECIANNN